MNTVVLTVMERIAEGSPRNPLQLNLGVIPLAFIRTLCVIMNTPQKEQIVWKQM